MSRVRLLCCLAVATTLASSVSFFPVRAMAQSDAVQINIDVLDDIMAPTAVERQNAPAPASAPASSSAAPSITPPSSVIPLKWVQTKKPTVAAPIPPAPQPVDKPFVPVVTAPQIPTIKPPVATPVLPVEKPVVSRPRPARPLMTVPTPVLKPTLNSGEETTATTSIPLPRRPPVPNPEYPPPMALPSRENAIPPVGTLPLIPVPAETVAAPIAETETAPDDTSPAVPSLSDLSLGFEPGSNDFSTDAQDKLDAIIAQMIDNEKLRLQLRAYAKAKDDSTARRISLARALAVRSYLMDHSINPSRVDVRALGSKSEREPFDRVDVVFTP